MKYHFIGWWKGKWGIIEDIFKEKPVEKKKERKPRTRYPKIHWMIQAKDGTRIGGTNSEPQAVKLKNRHILEGADLLEWRVVE